MKKILYYLLPVVLLVTACTKNISRFNVETKKPAAVPPGPLFTNATRSMCDILVGTNNNLRHVVKHWAQATNQEAAQYQFVLSNTSDNVWAGLYRDVLNDLQGADSLLKIDNITAPAVIQNERAIIDVVECYAFNTLVTTFGNVPYSQSLNYNNLFPAYDDGKTIQLDLLKRLAADVAAMAPASGSFAASEDLIYSGNVTNWIRFANSIRVMIGMTLSDVDPATAKATVEAASPLAFNGTSPDAVWKYGAVPSQNPLYTAIVQSGRSDYIAATDIMDPLKAMSDPRLPGFFIPNNSGVYVGSPVGTTFSFAGASRPSARVIAPDAPFVIMDYMEMEFYRAEAIERGFNVGGTATAEQHYDTAIARSITYWGGTPASANTYLSRPDVAYTTASGTFKQKIGYQKWLALYNRPFDGWLEMRRFDWPVLPPPIGAVSGYPNRLTYPSTTASEQTTNGANYTSAAAAIGGDKVETKLFWDKF